MKRFKTTLTLFLAGLPFGHTLAKQDVREEAQAAPRDPSDPVNLRPLNLPGDNLFAGHRSHSSHSSHRSSSGGGYSRPRPQQPAEQQPLPQKAPEAGSRLAPDGSAQPTDPGRAGAVSPTPARPAAPKLSTEEKRRLQIMRVQIQLMQLGLYAGPTHGVLDAGTKEAIKRFQTVKGLEANGLMTTPTLNALGVPAVE